MHLHWFRSEKSIMKEKNCNFSQFSCKERGKEMYYSNFDTQKSGRRWYQHDIDTIIYSDMFRKMQRKSQLFSMCDAISRSRLIHTFEVVRIAKEISGKLGLNTELTEGIALAHDFGNVAYGKTADKFLRAQTNDLFKHEEISELMVKVAASRLIPDKYRGVAMDKIAEDPSVIHEINIAEYPYTINVFKYRRSIYYICISPELLDGVVKHGTDGKNIFTLEGQVVNYADNIAYLIQDINDFMVTGIFTNADMDRYMRCLNDLAKKDTNKAFPISDIVGKTTSARTAVLIERFVCHNKNKLANKKYVSLRSPILNRDIPILEIEPIVKKAIDRCWDFKNEFYEHDLIKVSNTNSKAKIEQIWNILDENSIFLEKNRKYIEFNKFLSSPIFRTYRLEKKIDNELDWMHWKTACFIAHLTCDEIDQIINAYLSRDYLIDFSMPSISS